MGRAGYPLPGRSGLDPGFRIPGRTVRGRSSAPNNTSLLRLSPFLFSLRNTADRRRREDVRWRPLDSAATRAGHLRRSRPRPRARSSTACCHSGPRRPSRSGRCCLRFQPRRDRWRRRSGHPRSRRPNSAADPARRGFRALLEAPWDPRYLERPGNQPAPEAPERPGDQPDPGRPCMRSTLAMQILRAVVVSWSLLSWCRGLKVPRTRSAEA